MVKKSSKFVVTAKKVKTKVKTKPVVDDAERLAKGKKRLKKVKGKAKELKAKLKSDVSLNELLTAAEAELKSEITTNPKVKARTLQAPRSEEDYRKEYARQFVRLNSLEKQLMLDIEVNGNSRAIYQVIQVIQQKNAVLSDMWDLKSVDDKVVAVATRVLEPAFRKITMSCTDLVQEIRRMLRLHLKPADFEKLDKLVVDATKSYAKDFQNHYDAAVEQTAVIAEEEL